MLVASVGVVLSFGMGCASTHGSAQGASGLTATEDAHARDPLRGPGELRVMTFNIQSALHGVEKVAEVIRSVSPDVVALQEVDAGTTRARGQNQADLLSLRTDLPHRAHFRATTLFGGDYGVAILSRFPIAHAQTYRLPTPRGLEPRTVAHVVLDVEGREVSVYVTHLTNATYNSSVRVMQARAISRLMSLDARPQVLMGDFNDAPDSAAVLTFARRAQNVFDRCGVGPAETYPLPAFLPNLRLDYVFASRDIKAKRAFVVRKLASDHYPIVADLQLPFAPAEVASAPAQTVGRASP